MTGNELYDLFGEEEEKLIGYRSGMWDKVNEYKVELFDRVALRITRLGDTDKDEENQKGQKAKRV